MSRFSDYGARCQACHYGPGVKLQSLWARRQASVITGQMSSFSHYGARYSFSDYGDRFQASVITGTGFKLQSLRGQVSSFSHYGDRFQASVITGTGFKLQSLRARCQASVITGQVPLFTNCAGCQALPREWCQASSCGRVSDSDIRPGVKFHHAARCPAPFQGWVSSIRVKLCVCVGVCVCV